jgi:energy-coupling factor transporter ATP-binding protein EcfA2
MLLRFEAANYRSILEPVELSMIAVDEDRPAARSFDLLNERVLAIAGIYGPNASGKSNVVEALAWLSMAVQWSLRVWDKIIPREPFKFGRGPHEPSRYEIEMVVAGIRYTYRVEVDGSTVLFEGLYSYPERRRRVLFEREDLDISFRRGLGSLAGTRELLTPSTLALSAAMRLHEPDVEPFARALASIQALGLRRQGLWRSNGVVPPLDSPSSTERLFGQQETLFDEVGLAGHTGRSSALALLRFADLGIYDVKIVQGEGGTGLAQQGSRRRSRLQLMHRVAGERIPFELSEESAGTQTWFALIGPALSALNDGRVLLVDEIDASLHPRLSARLLELFQDPETNPNDAQLIFTTHDTSLLNFLNRDEVWLTEKGDNGATTLTALAEYGGDKVRRSLNLERAYLQGRFGAVPDLDQYTLRRALGLVPDES